MVLYNWYEDFVYTRRLISAGKKTWAGVMGYYNLAREKRRIFLLWKPERLGI